MNFEPLKRTRLWIGFVLAAAIALSAQFSHAKNNFNPDKFTLVINIFEAVVQYPAPSWFTSTQVFDQVEIYRKRDGWQFLIEFIPKGESFEAWSKMLALRGYYLPGDKKIPIPVLANPITQMLFKVCGAKNIAYQEVTMTDQEATYVMFCTSSPGGLSQFGYGPDVGEILLKSVRRQDDTYIEIYHEWRGKRFNVDDPQTWPASPDTIKEMIRRFKTIHLSKSKVPFK